MGIIKTIALNEKMFQGAVSVERLANGGWKPWRIPYRDLTLYPPDGIGGKAEVTAGARVSGISGTSSVTLGIEAADGDRRIDCVIDGRLVRTAQARAGETVVRFGDLPPAPAPVSASASASRTIELYLDQAKPVVVTGLEVDDDAGWEPVGAARPRWMTYGSSISQCSEADSPARTWPALVAREHNLDLLCLGYAGQCMLEPMVARMMRDLPADYISCCLGINVYGKAALTPRTFKPAVIGFLQLIREKHPNVPLAVISPIYSPGRETEDNAVGFTLQRIRSEIEDVVRMLQERGDASIRHVNGLELFGEADAAAGRLPDDLHPDSEGYRIMGERFSEIVARGIWGLNG